MQLTGDLFEGLGLNRLAIDRPYEITCLNAGLCSWRILPHGHNLERALIILSNLNPDSSVPIGVDCVVDIRREIDRVLLQVERNFKLPQDIGTKYSTKIF